MSNALSEYFSPFYTLGHQFGFDREDQKAYIANGAKASLDGRIVTIAYDGHTLTGRTKLGRTRRAAKWVNQFNAKARVV